MHAVEQKKILHMAFEFTFLGSGTSQGVPIIGKDYPAGISRQSEELAHPSLHLCRHRRGQVRGGYDAGVPHPDACAKTSGGWMRCVFTHSHADHIMGLDDCRRFCDLRGGTALPIYANEVTMTDLRRVFQYAFHSGPWPEGLFHSRGTRRHRTVHARRSGDNPFAAAARPIQRMVICLFKMAKSAWPT
ncbi:MAG: MBL fold metallo-hydrolase [Verrucomicrobiota bacterium]